MIVLGLLLGMIGTDGNTGTERFTFGLIQLSDGIDVATLAIGIFGIAEVISNLSRPGENRSVISQKIKRLWPERDDFRRAVPAVLRGTALGSVLGVLPGGGATLSSFAAYALEKKLSREPGRFGHGAVEGIAAPESANNAASQTSFIPMLTLGIPGNAVMALMIGALMIHGIQPGPQIITERPMMFWGMIASMWIGNTMLLFFNLPLIGMWVQLLKLPYRFLYLAILLFCAVGVYTVSNSTFAILLAASFGVLGYVLYLLDCEVAPLILGFVLGPLMEENLRRAMRISGGDPMIFLQRPISLGLLVGAAILLVIVTFPAVRAKREEAFQE
jgi:TctA family transporter